MKTERLSLKSIKNVLSRSEMKKIMAGGSNGGFGCPGVACALGTVCPCGTQCFVNPADSLTGIC